MHSVSTCFWSWFWLPHSLHIRSSLNVVLWLVLTGGRLRLVRIIVLHCFLLSFSVHFGLCSTFVVSLFFIQCLILVFDMASFFISWYVLSLLRVSKTLLKPFLLILRFSSESLYSAKVSVVLFLQWLFLCVSCWVMGLSCYGFCGPALFSFSLLFFPRGCILFRQVGYLWAFVLVRIESFSGRCSWLFGSAGFLISWGLIPQLRRWVWVWLSSPPVAI